MSDPRVSIITPSYNQGGYLSQTLESVLSQNYANIEHIIIDGGSSDKSVEIIRQYETLSPHRVIWVSEPDKGQADAINKGFGLCSGQFIGWINSDDGYLLKSTIREVVDTFLQFPGADIVYGDVALLSAESRLLKIQCMTAFNYSRLLRGCYLIQPAVFFRRKVIDKHLLDTSINIAVDYEFWLRLGKIYNLQYIPKLWAFDRNHPARKILAKRNELITESRQIKERFGWDQNGLVFLQRIFDKLIYGLPTKLRGLISFIKLRHKDPILFAVTVKFDPFLISSWRQIWKKNKDLR